MYFEHATETPVCLFVNSRRQRDLDVGARGEYEVGGLTSCGFIWFGCQRQTLTRQQWRPIYAKATFHACHHEHPTL